MFRKEVNERSPMRVFESSMHGGLGKGNLGVVVSRPGRGKSALLVQIALDDLLRERIRFLGGTFEIESRPGEGTRAIVGLPLVDGAFGRAPSSGWK